MSTYPSITLTGVNNLSIDNTSQVITGLQRGTRYNFQGIMTHTGTGKMKLVPKLKDNLNNVVEFTTSDTEIVSFTTTPLVKTFHSISTTFTFVSNSTATYRVNFEMYYYTYNVYGGWAYTLAHTWPHLSVVNGQEILINMTSLQSEQQVRVLVTFYNNRTREYYNGGQKFVVFTDQQTNAYQFLTGLNDGSTSTNATQASIYVNELRDNTGDTGVSFNSVIFRLSEARVSPVTVTKTNVAFIQPGTSQLRVDFAGLIPNTTYLLSGIFTRNGFYTSKGQSFNKYITTEPYTVTFKPTNISLPNTTSIQFQFESGTPDSFKDNSGNLNPIDIKFYVYLPTDLVNPVNPAYEYLAIPFNTTRTFLLTNLQPGTEYVVKAKFTKAGNYLDLEYPVFTQATLSTLLNASLTVTAPVADQNSVTFTIQDFQSEFPDDTHIVSVYALRHDQVVILEEALIAYWDFSSYSLVDGLGNRLTVTGQHSFDSPYFEAEENNVALAWAPADWSIFEGLSRDFRFVISGEIFATTTERLRCEFKNATNDPGYSISIVNNLLIFSGGIRISDGNSVNHLFLLQYNVSIHPGGFFDVERKIECTLLLYPINASQNFGTAKILIDDVEVASMTLNNSTGQFSASTVEEGVYLRTFNTALSTDYFSITAPSENSKIYFVKMGSQSRTAY